jgi:hypothetical protein
LVEEALVEVERRSLREVVGGEAGAEALCLSASAPAAPLRH